MEISSTPEKYRAPAPKTYYHAHNYARFIFDMRESLQHPAQAKPVEFAGNKYVTDDTREIAQLDAVADQSGTFIYTIKDSPIAAQIAQEIGRETGAAIVAAANAGDAARNVRGNEGAPIVAVNTGGTPAVAAIVGMQNSLASSQPVDVPAGTAPGAAAAAALAALNNLQK